MTFVAVLLCVQFLARPHYLPVTTVTAFPSGQGVTFSPDQANAPGDWLLDWGVVDPSGHRLDTAATNTDFQSAYDTHLPVNTWLRDHGIEHLLVYQPADRFWTFQLIETGIFLALSAILAAVAVWQVHRRLP